MSTKTSIKRIALVAVAALGFGMVSTVAANAADTQVAAGTISAVNLKKASANVYTIGQTVKVFAGATSVGEAAIGAGDGLLVTLTAALTSYPTGGFVGASGNNSGTLDFTATNTDTVSGASVVLQVADNTALDAETISATTTDGLAAFTAVPAVAGDYVMTVWHDQNGNGSIDLTEARQTIAFTMAAASGLVPSASIVRIATVGTAITANPETSDAAYSTTLNAKSYSAAKGTAAATNRIAQVAIILLNADGTASTSGHTVTATVSGSGLVLLNANGAAADGTKRADSYSAAAGTNVVIAHISTDGTAGTGTVSFSVTDAVSGATTAIGSKSFTSYGSVSSIAIDTTNYTIGRAGYTTGGAVAGRAAANEVDITTPVSPFTAGVSTPAFVVVTKDSAGNAANIAAAGVPTIVSSDATVVSGGTCVADNGTDATYSSGPGWGYYNCNFSVAANAASGSSATLTIRTPDPASLTGGYLTTTYKVTVGGSIYTEKLVFDSSSYTPGQGITVSQTAVDSAGNPVYDGAAAHAVSFNKAIGGSAPAADYYVGGKLVSDNALGAKTVFAPGSEGEFMGSITGKVAGVASTITASATVSSDSGSSAAIDAANEATDAANAATDAANAAAEAADAATAAAQDAQAAVAALATSVSSLIAGIKAQITSLTNLVIKIQKKVKA